MDPRQSVPEMAPPYPVVRVPRGKGQVEARMGIRSEGNLQGQIEREGLDGWKRSGSHWLASVWKRGDGGTLTLGRDIFCEGAVIDQHLCLLRDCHRPSSSSAGAVVSEKRVEQEDPAIGLKALASSRGHEAVFREGVEGPETVGLAYSRPGDG
jgi:hypothetical protein